MMNWTKQLATPLFLLGIFAFAMITPTVLRPVAAQEAETAHTKNSETDQNDLAKKMIGTWKLEQASSPGSPSGVATRLKFFTGTHWCILQPDSATGVLVFVHGGRYQVQGDQVKTTRDFAGESTKSMIPGTKTLTLQVDGDTMTQIDQDGDYNETWKRVISDPAKFSEPITNAVSPEREPFSPE